MNEMKEHLDGKGFAAWIQEQVGDPDFGMTAALGESLFRRFSEWRRGGTVTLDVADKVCVRLGYHIDIDVPEHLWCDPPQKGKPVRMSWERARAMEMLGEGYFPAEVGRMLGVSSRQIRSWREFERRNPGATAAAGSVAA